MNKKGKNKKGKIPNPVPQESKTSEQSEDVGKSGDKVEEAVIEPKLEQKQPVSENIQKLEEKGDSVKEERVPEIVSEIITPQATAKDEETPKKPKRNRGKKKKGKDDDDFDDNIEEKPKVAELEAQEVPQETKVETPIVETERKPEELPEVTPTARKKKNKKNKAEQKVEDQHVTELKSPIIPSEIQTKEAELEEPSSEIKQDILKAEATEQEISKSSKKKKNKKKRNDSERSDKEFTVTAAFQENLDDKPTETKAEEKVTQSKEIATPDIAKIEIVPEKEKDTLPVVPLIKEKSVTPARDIESPIVEGKGKKKNKKDKKHPPKSEEIIKSEEEIKIEQAETLQETEITAPVVVPTDVTTIVKEDLKKDVTTIEEPQPVAEESSPKPKAKIAKPVEKKKKGKHETLPTENISQEAGPREPIAAKEEPSEIKTEILEPKTTETALPTVVPSTTAQPEIATDIMSLITDIPDEEEKLIAQEFELLAEKATNKKRKKGPKPAKTLDMTPKAEETVTEPDKQDETKEIKPEQLPVITEILTPQPDQLEFTIMSEKSNIATPAETVLDIGEFHGKELLTPETIIPEKEFVKEEDIAAPIEEKQQSESKSGKKRKKSPKPPKKTESKPEVQAPLETGESSKDTFKSEEVTKQSLGENIAASNITRMYDIEISSLKADESEGSICDVVPDVTYPRASSQQLLDDNNNTVVGEIFQLEERILDSPRVSEMKETQKKPTEVKEPTPTTSKEEKTDLKSKMMEVNQDMEELRLSIERSLAELTSIEKTEENLEKKFEETRSQAEKVSSLLFGPEEKVDTQKLVQESVIEKIPEQTSKNPFMEMMQAESKSVKAQTIEEILQYPLQSTKGGKSKNKGNKDKPKPEPSKTKTFEDLMPAFASQPILPPMVIEEKPIMTPFEEKLSTEKKPKVEEQKPIKSEPIPLPPIPLPFTEEKKAESIEIEKKDIEEKPKEPLPETPTDVPPVCPARKDNKGKNKKKKGKQDSQVTATVQSTTQSATTSQTQSTSQDTKKEEKTESKTETKSDSTDQSGSKEKGKHQSDNVDSKNQEDGIIDTDFEPIENFEDALTSSADDVNKTFEMIVKESQEQNNPKINIIAATPDEEKPTVTPPKNLLGHPDIPVRSNKRDYKKEKDKIPNEITARVKIKDAVEVEKKQSKNTQTINKMKEFSKEYKINDNDDFVYKYSFRKVFLQSCCHVCKKELSGSRVACCYCNLLFYCSNKHKDDDWPQHQALCFAVSTIGHLKDQKHIYADAKNLTGHDYRLIRMQMIVSCEKILKRRLVPWEQEALLYPRICAHVPCREWRQSKLSDCQGCGQLSYCTDSPDHFPKSHARWCKSYSLYEKLVSYQQSKGRLEPKMPTKVLQDTQEMPEKINEVLASMYEEKIDINDIQYAALTQLATAPLTTAYCYQLYRNKVGSPPNGVNKKTSFTIHVVGAELQFEADALNKWEVFFLHLRPDLQELRVVLINYNLNPSNLPLELLGKIKLCDNCRQNKRRVVFSFQDKKTYNDYKSSDDFVMPDVVCAFNPSIQRSSVYNGKDPWPTAINIILKLKVPFIITGYTITELHRDCIKIKECSESGFSFISEPKYNTFASVRPDRNFISDDEMPLLFKNYCFAIISG